MALIGYARVSTNEQDTAMQVAAMRRAGVDEIVQERQSAVKKRPALDRLLGEIRPGDTLVVYKLDRLARSMPHFVRVFELLRSKSVGFRSLTEAIETETPQGRMFLNLLGVFAEFERELIRERCHAGQGAARAAGKTWGRPAAFTLEEGQAVARLWREGWAGQALLADIFDVRVACLRDTIHRVEKRGRWASKK